LRVFELTPSPWREHDTIVQILDTYQRQHGDTVFVISFRWWDKWKDYTEKNPATLEYQAYVEKVHESIAQNPTLSEDLKHYLIGDDGDPGTVDKTEWFDQMKNSA
jgi:hypothetical protein